MAEPAPSTLPAPEPGPRPTRNEFIGFLDALTMGDCTNEEWLKFIVEHYADDEVEHVRRQVVRMMALEKRRDVEQIRKWAGQLRGSA